MNTFTKNLFLWITIILVVLLLFNLFQNGNSGRVSTELAYSDFVESVKAGNIREVTISGNSISAATTSGRTITTFSPQGANIVHYLKIVEYVLLGNLLNEKFLGYFPHSFLGFLCYY